MKTRGAWVFTGSGSGAGFGVRFVRDVTSLPGNKSKFVAFGFRKGYQGFDKTFNIFLSSLEIVMKRSGHWGQRQRYRIG